MMDAVCKILDSNSSEADVLLLRLIRPVVALGYYSTSPMEIKRKVWGVFGKSFARLTDTCGSSLYEKYYLQLENHSGLGARYYIFAASTDGLDEFICFGPNVVDDCLTNALRALFWFDSVYDVCAPGIGEFKKTSDKSSKFFKFSFSRIEYVLTNYRKLEAWVQGLHKRNASSDFCRLSSSLDDCRGSSFELGQTKCNWYICKAKYPMFQAFLPS
jgi:hypothetical protein